MADPNMTGIMVDDLTTGRRPLGSLGSVVEAQTVNGVTSLIGAGGTIEGLDVNLIPRSGALADLRLAAGFDGELSVATDCAAILKHNGVANGAVVVTCRRLEVARKGVAFANTLVSGTPLIPDLEGVVTGYSDYSTQYGATGFTVPAWANRASVEAWCIFPANATGIRSITTLFNQAFTTDKSVTVATNAAASGTTTVMLNSPSVIVSPGMDIELQLNQTSGGDLTPIANSIFLKVSFWAA